MTHFVFPGSLILFDLLAHQADQVNTNITAQPLAQIVSEHEQVNLFGYFVQQ